MKKGALEIGEVVGCLEPTSGETWRLTNATEPIISETQATTSVALKKAEVKPLGSQRYRLLGVHAFEPSRYEGQKVAVKGVLIKDSNEIRINVTSLQMIANRCVK
jgi:hypothetical protein